MRLTPMDRGVLQLDLPGQQAQTQEDVNPYILRLASSEATSPSHSTSLTVEDIADDEGRVQQFLTSNYHLLCKKIFMSLDVFYSWLRSQGIFTIHDQELVEGTYPLKLDKAGHLIDIITYNKGTKGFKAFMEVIEYEFPFVFTHIMGTKAGRPPPEYRGSIQLEGSRERNSNPFWDQAMLDINTDLQKTSSKMTEIIQKFKLVAEKAQEMEHMTLQTMQEEIATLKEEKASAENLAAKYLLERDEGCKICCRYQQMKDTSNEKVVELSQQVTHLQRELSKLKSGHLQPNRTDSVKMLEEIRQLVGQRDASQEHHIQELREQLEQLKHERDHLYSLWQLEKGKREKAYAECSYYIEKAKQLENEMEQLTAVAYTTPRSRACNLKDRKDLPSGITKKLVTPTTEFCPPVFDNNTDIELFDFDNNVDAVSRHNTHVLISHPKSMVETERYTFRQHPQSTVLHGRWEYLSPFLIQVTQKCLNTDLLVLQQPKRSTSMETVEVDTNLLKNNIKLLGGSYTGIFVEEVDSTNYLDINVTVGDQILKMGQSLQDMYNVDGMTLEHVLTLLKRLSGSVILSKLSNISGLETLLQARKNKEVIQGDCFCVVIEKESESVRCADWLPLERGSLVMVTQTVHTASCDCKTCWFGLKLSHKNANLLQSGCLASELKSKKMTSMESFNEGSRGMLVRQGAVKCKISPYVYVQPYKACYQRPVVVFSPTNLREPLHEALLKLSDLFIPYQTDHLFRCEMDEVGEEMMNHLLAVASRRTQHLLLTVREQDVKHLQAAGIYPIILLLQTDSEKQHGQHIQKVFYRHEYEVIPLDHSTAADMDELAKRLGKQVEMMQTDIIWVRCSKVTAPL